MNLRLSSASSSQDKGLSYVFRYIYPIDVEDTVPFAKTFPFASRQVDCTFDFAVTFSSYSCAHLVSRSEPRSCWVASRGDCAYPD